MLRVLLLGGLLLSSAAYGKEQHIQCPLEYPAQEIKLSHVPKGWDGLGIILAGTRLRNAGAIDGPYSGLRAELRGSDRQTKDGSEHHFAFGSKEKWIYCGYGGEVELLHRVAPEATQCVIKYVSKKQSVDLAISITCR